MTPQELGHYRLDHVLGHGGMGVVYRAHDTRHNRDVALKLLSEGFSQDEEFKSRFRRESRVAARLREPHIIPIHDFGEIGDKLFIDMRLVDGQEISKILAENGPLPPARAVQLIGQVADALDAAHAEGLVHRDIKPSNILVTATDFVYVVDFGIARSVGSARTSLTISGATVGTLEYMSPERFTLADIDGRSDVYSMACVLLECLTGRRPFTGHDLPSLMFAHLHTPPPPLSSIVHGLPGDLDAVIARGLAKRPEDRYPTAGAMAQAARAALLSAPTVPSPQSVVTVRVDEPGPRENPDPAREQARGPQRPPTPPPSVVGPIAAPAPIAAPGPIGAGRGPGDGRDPGHGSRRRPRRLVVGLAVFAVLLIAAVVTLAVRGVGPSQLAGEGRVADDADVSTAGRPSPTKSTPVTSSRAATVIPVSSAAPSSPAAPTTPVSTPPAEPTPTPPPPEDPAVVAERAIRTVIPPSLSCTTAAPVDGGVAAVGCTAGDVAVLYEAFADAAGANAALDRRATALGAPAGECGEDEATWVARYHRADHTVAAGRMLCYQPADSARLVWTQDDQPTLLTSATLPGTGQVHHEIYNRWLTDEFGPQTAGAAVTRGGCSDGEC